MANSGTIRNININNIRKVLGANESISKSDLAKYIGLSFPTVSNTIEYLIKKNEVIEVGIQDSLGGRCAKKYSLNPMYALSLSLYLEGFKLCWIVNDFCENKIESGSVICKSDILMEIDKVVSLIKSKYHQLASIMIGVASNVNDGKIISEMEYIELQGVDIVKYFKDKYDIPVNIENDMNVAAIGYWERHENNDIEAVVSIYMGENGVGSSLVINGKVWGGASNFAGEIHYLPICEDNKIYPICGFRDINIVEYYGNIIQSYIALVNPNLIVLYNNSYIENKLDEIKNYCKSRVPRIVIPEIIISNEFRADYEYGLNSMANELIS
ncbi:MAG: ROK family protein [Clostridium septicum]|uniref:ROK family protein n=1 Tax=Clostridium septicum TaxID=1504 RepID=UPI0025881AA2|nr:ROK family protein [Clostridium septicum]MDU1313290.1 ROK family protein [Clostridium septicum]WLF69406.1 ROK family protein [Clostridium septicum]